MTGAKPKQLDRTAQLATGMGCFTFAVCYFRLFIFPDIPIVPGGDQIGFINEGARIVAGQLPYRDFFAMLPAGLPCTYALLVKVFGLVTWIPGLAMSCVAAATALLMTLASGRLMRGSVVALPALVFAGFILLVSADATHHWFSTVLVLTGMLVLLGGDSSIRIAVAGAGCGAAACFTQTKGATALAGFLAYLIWKSPREQLRGRGPLLQAFLLCGVALGVFAAVNGYFIETAGLGRWFYCLVLYPLRYYPAPSINNWHVIEYDFQWHPGAARWVAFPFVYCTVPLVYIVSLFVLHREARRRSGQSTDKLMLVALTGIAMFIAVASSPSLKRLSTVSPPAMILLVWLLDRPRRTVAALRAALATAAVTLAIVPVLRTQTRRLTFLDLPAGRTAFVDGSVYEEYLWVLAHTHPGQFFWGMPPLDLPFHLQNPAAIEALETSEYTRPEDVAALVDALHEHHVPMIMLPSENKYPLTVDSPSNHVGPFATYLHDHYRQTKTFTNGDEVWEVNSGASSRPE